MASQKILRGFCKDVQSGLKKKAGVFDWSSLIAALLPVLVSMISTCFSTSADLQEFSGGKRSRKQLASLRVQCLSTVRKAGIRGPLKISAAASSLQDEILAQLDEQAGKCAGEIWEQAYEEAAQAA